MLKYEWIKTTITKNREANQMVRLFNEVKPTIGAFDTETTGLHIIHDKPFLYQFGFLDDKNKIGYTFAVDIEEHPALALAVINKWQELAKSFVIYFGHNVKYDLHIMINLGYPYNTNNISDTMFYIRAAHDALKESNGGPPLGLKEYSARFIYSKAKEHERLLDKEKSAIAKEINIKLKNRLRKCGKPPDKYKAKSYTLSVMNEIFKDPIIDIEDLPEEIKEEYINWLEQDVPDYIRHKVTAKVEPEHIPYNKLNRENIILYGHWDIILTLEIYLKTNPVVKARETEDLITIENELIYPLVEMERTGFEIDVSYLLECKEKVKEYIKNRRKHIWELSNREFKTGQHNVIKNILIDKYHLDLESTDKNKLIQIVAHIKRNKLNTPEHQQVVEFIETLQELRTLEKWYSVYIMRFLKDLKIDTKIYPTILSVGTVTGRVSSAFQQFPRDGIVDNEKNVLFHPRQIVVGDIVCIDFSQIELRLQAIYTILCYDPDKNMCRAYMPYQCYRDDLGERIEFDYNKPEHIKMWGDLREGYPNPSDFKDGMEEVYKQGWSVWKHIEDNEYWTPVDLHAATTILATGLDKHHPDFKNLRRDVGKKVNFGKQYGASLGKVIEMFPEKTLEECKKIDAAYYAAFPGVRTYHDYCTIRGNEYPYTSNLFGIKYYGLNGHKLKNTLVQGSAAYYLKWKIKQIYDYIKENNLKTRMMFQVHDEILFLIHPDEIEHVFKFKEIMEDWEDTLVPIVTEVDATNTSWSNKKGVHTIEELRVYFRD